MSIQKKPASQGLVEAADKVELVRMREDVSDVVDCKLADYEHDLRRLAKALEDDEGDDVAGTVTALDELACVRRAYGQAPARPREGRDEY